MGLCAGRMIADAPLAAILVGARAGENPYGGL